MIVEVHFGELASSIKIIDCRDSRYVVDEEFYLKSQGRLLRRNEIYFFQERSRSLSASPDRVGI